MTASASLQNDYKNDRWKWVSKLFTDEDVSISYNLLAEKITNSNMVQSYGIDKPPKLLPCRKKCTSSPFCLASISNDNKSEAIQLTEQLRNKDHPIGLQNTANTCWINSAIQALFNIYQFRNCINSIEGFKGDESLDSLDYLLQAMFVEMQLHRYKAMACSPSSVFEKLAVFVTKEIMQKDKDYEVLKCVSEFLENTIDNLLANPRTEPIFSSIFKTLLYRVAKWKCTSCQKEHVRQLPPDTCYTMAAYVSADECPLDQCILDLQTETQTGVSLICEGGTGCGSTVIVDRVVTPQLLSLPSLLIIRNNSLLDTEIKRRLHVVYSEKLDLRTYTCSNEPATYSLRAVIYHHGHWIKHFSAHVKSENGKWFNFNDEKVSGLETRTGNAQPLETHKDYFSFPNVANKYKKKSGLRVSRGSFIWIYQRETSTKETTLLPAPKTVLDYVNLNKKDGQNVDARLLEQSKNERENLFDKLAVENLKQKYSLISSPVLTSWYGYQGLKFVPQPSLLAEGLCEHGKFDPTLINSFKIIKEDQGASLLKQEYGIHSGEKVPIIYSLDEAMCKQCVSRHAHHIMFTNYLKDLYKKAKKDSSKEKKSDTTFIGTFTMSNWIKIALNCYRKENGFDMDEAVDDSSSPTNTHEENKDTNGTATKPYDETPVKTENGDGLIKHSEENGSKKNNHADETATKENNHADETASKGNEFDEENFTLINEDIICHHNNVSPDAAGVWIPDNIVSEIKRHCSGMIHPAMLKEDFDLCPQCLNSRDRTLETCQGGKEERRRLYHLFTERRRPHSVRDEGKKLYFLSREFLTDWKLFVRLSAKQDPQICRPRSISNSCILCKHNNLLYTCNSDKENSVFSLVTLVWEEEWDILKEYYSFDSHIEAHYEQEGKLVSNIAPCDKGCIEAEISRLYEEQFVYSSGGINIRQVNSVIDVPRQSLPTAGSDDILPSKRQRIEVLKEGNKSTYLRKATQRLVRASKWFSSLDTIKEVQNFIADRTGIWPLLQTLWLAGDTEHGHAPFLLTDKHRSMTLSALRIKAGDTIYFRATKEDLEKAAGDGETEYNELDDMEEDN